MDKNTIYNALIKCEIMKAEIENKHINDFDCFDMLILQRLGEKIKFYKILLGLETNDAIKHCENLINKGGDVLC